MIKKIVVIEIEGVTGHRYIPIDNSYVQNLRDKSWANLYHCTHLYAISEPYSEKVNCGLHPDTICTFINVIDRISGEKYRVMYSPAGVQD